MAFRWRANEGPINIECWIGRFVILRGSGPVLLRNPIFRNFPGGGGGGGGGGPGPRPTLDPQMDNYLQSDDQRRSREHRKSRF